jgi:predicted ATPase
MLTRWSIENFKSFCGRTQIELAPISVFAGANSSGKSTIIQSILLLKQTLQYAPANRPLALNGPLLKLGTFNDVKNASSDEAYVGIEWELDVEDWRYRHRPQPYLGAWGPSFYFGEQTVKSIIGKFQWDVSPAEAPGLAGPSEIGGNPELLQLQPRLALSTIDATLAKENHAISHLSIARSYTVRVLNYSFKADIDPESEDELLKPKPDGRIIGASSQNFFPGELVIEYDAAKEWARRVTSVLLGAEQLYTWSARDVSAVTVAPEVVRHIEQWLMQGQEAGQQPLSLFPEPREQPVPIADLVERVRRALISASSTPSRPLNLAELRRDLEGMLLKGEKPKNAVDLATPRAISEAVRYATQYFLASVRYLGPLRDEPKPVYPLEALANPTEVGYKGEHTAAVLDLHRELRIQYIPSAFIDRSNFPATQSTATLHDAVVDWLSYVGVASEVSTSESGKFGHQLTVQTQGLNRFHDLTNVGVGVSQVLPIIVMALLAEKPSFLIFEQPELHLHPMVQARLADFFLSVALSGKQCLIETHSEYLIERFRRRVAEAQGDALTRLLKIYFTERENGQTTCRPVEVTKYGAIPDWPKDFFDQSQSETEHILQAATIKRAAERVKQ